MSIPIPKEVINPSVTKEVDIYRDTTLRYLGYSNELGESFRPLIKKWVVNLSYGVAVAYVLADVQDKTRKMYNNPPELGGGTYKNAAITATDVFAWQMLASVIIPGATINRLCWATGKMVKKSKIKGIAGKWVPTIVGLMSIPFIIKPIDKLVDFAMDESFRKYVK